MNIAELNDIDLAEEYRFVRQAAETDGEYADACREIEEELVRRKFIGPIVAFGGLLS